MERFKNKDFNYLVDITKHMDFQVFDLGDGKVRISSEEQKFDLVFDTLPEALDFITDIN